LTLGKASHLAHSIKKFFENTADVFTSVEHRALVAELIKEYYGQSFDQLLEGGWISGRHPLTAHSATKCILSNWFKHNRFPREELPSRVQATFRVGGIVELELYAASLFAGEDCSHYQHKLTIERGGWPTNNYLDWIHKSKVDGKRRVVDCKTMSSYAFQRLFDRGEALDDTFGYCGQMSNYIDECLEQGLVDSDEGIFLCYKKDTGHIEEYVYTMDKSLVRESNLSSKIIHKVPVLTRARGSIER